MITIPQIEKAKKLAEKLHSKQLYGKLPYTAHLSEVAFSLSRFGFYDYSFPKLHVAAWLHDSMEDTGITEDELEDNFGIEVCDIVSRVTCSPGKNRKIRFSNTYPRTRGNFYSIILKLADRIANMENCLREKNSPMLSMYSREYPEFRHNLNDLYQPNDPELKDDARMLSMWAYLDALFNETESILCKKSEG